MIDINRIKERVEALSTVIGDLDIEWFFWAQRPNPSCTGYDKVWSRVDGGTAFNSVVPYQLALHELGVQDLDKYETINTGDTKGIQLRDRPLSLALAQDIKPIVESVVGKPLFVERAVQYINTNSGFTTPHYDKNPDHQYTAVCVLYSDEDWPLHGEGYLTLSRRAGDIVIATPHQIRHWAEPYRGELCIRELMRYSVVENQRCGKLDTLSREELEERIVEGREIVNNVHT